MSKTTLAATALAVALVPGLAGAQTNGGGQQELAALVKQQIDFALPNGAGDVVAKLGQLKPDGAISKGFNLANVSRWAFGRDQASAAPDCHATTTAAKEPDEGLCVIEVGSRDDARGAYKTLAFSKNVGQGNVLFVNRPAFDPASQAPPTPVKSLTNDLAMQRALQFMSIVGVPKSEIPIAPAGVKNALPVRDLAVAAEQEPRKGERIVIQKVVALPRAFEVPGGLHKLSNGMTVTHVRVPGSALIAMNDAGVQYASIEGWSDAQIMPVERGLAKSNAELAGEIAEDLWNEGVRKVGSMSVVVSLRRGYPNPDDPNPPICPVCGWLLPAVQVTVSQAGPGAVQTSEKAFVAPGLVREYDLARQAEGRAAR